MGLLFKIKTSALKKKYGELSDKEIVDLAITGELTEDAGRIIMDEIENRNLLQEYFSQMNRKEKISDRIKKYGLYFINWLGNLLICVLLAGHGLDAIVTGIVYRGGFRSHGILLQGADARICGVIFLFMGLFASTELFGFAYRKIFPKIFPKHERKLKVIYFFLLAAFIYLFFILR